MSVTEPDRISADAVRRRYLARFVMSRAERLGLARCMVTFARFDPADLSWLGEDAQ